MAVNSELNSFITKFSQLWHDGMLADLHFHCKDGLSYVNLQVGLGYAAQNMCISRTTSRERRRARRFNAKHKIEPNAKESSGEEEEQIVSSDIETDVSAAETAAK